MLIKFEKSFCYYYYPPIQSLYYCKNSRCFWLVIVTFINTWNKWNFLWSTSLQDFKKVWKEYFIFSWCCFFQSYIYPDIWFWRRCIYRENGINDDVPSEVLAKSYQKNLLSSDIASNPFWIYSRCARITFFKNGSVFTITN